MDKKTQFEFELKDITFFPKTSNNTMLPGGERTMLDVLQKEKAGFEKKGDQPTAQKILEHE